MRLLLCLRIALLFTLVFADRHEDHHQEGKDDPDHHDLKDGHCKKAEDDDYEESLPCTKIALNISKFSFDLYRQVALDHPSENIVLSPVGISIAFTLLSLGAKDQTKSQIFEVLGFNMSEISEQEIYDCFHELLSHRKVKRKYVEHRSENALFISNGHKILPPFLNGSYDLEVFHTDFKIRGEEAKNLINSYLINNTNGLIADLLESVDQDAILLLMSCIYFRGQWETLCDESLTQEDNFHVNKTTTVKVPFMKMRGNYIGFLNNDSTMISIAYDCWANALFILPKEGTLSEVEQNYSEEIINQWEKSKHHCDVHFYLPKFSVSGNIDLKDILYKLGLEDISSDKTDLSGITGANLNISQAIHQAVLNVNEKETEAAGSISNVVVSKPVIPVNGKNITSTTTVTEKKCKTTVTEKKCKTTVTEKKCKTTVTEKECSITVSFTRPFIFLIYDNSAGVLFSGRIINPQK